LKKIFTLQPQAFLLVALFLTLFTRQARVDVLVFRVVDYKGSLNELSQEANLFARGLKPTDVLKWKDDLWLFPYYTNRNFLPYDAR